MARRIFFFVVTNLAVLVTISIVMNVLGIAPYIDANYGINYTSLMIFCGLWGFGGAFISLAISKWTAKRMMGVQIIDPHTTDPAGRRLVDMVYNLSQKAGLPKMPEVGFYQSPEVNAFATGPSKSNSLVAVSSGLLEQMNSGEVEGVLGHEVAHIANGDMVTMTLIQGVVNAFVMFFARIAATVVGGLLQGDDERGPGLAHFGLVILFDILFGILGSMVVAWFSRQREFRADAGGAAYAGRDKMVGALKRLESTQGRVLDQAPSMAALKISGARKGMMAMLRSHPPLSDRIARLQSVTATRPQFV